MTNERIIQIIVLRLKGDSCKKNQVSIGNVKYETPNANNLTDHALPVILYDIFVAQNASKDIGIARIIDMNSALSALKPSISCRLQLIHTRQCIKIKIPTINK
jgi:hypothetical protein